MNKIVTKWIEPYVLLEILKKNCKLIKDFTFDGFSKNDIKQEFSKQLKKENHFGLYMKNVNKFYLFQGDAKIEEILSLTPSDFQETDDFEEAINAIDMGKAEASFLKY